MGNEVELTLDKSITDVNSLAFLDVGGLSFGQISLLLPRLPMTDSVVPNLLFPKTGNSNQTKDKVFAGSCARDDIESREYATSTDDFREFPLRRS